MSHLLTVCIPTFNRQKFLSWAIDKTVLALPESKIVVSDNASYPFTTVPKRVRLIRQDQNIGPFPNMRAALLAADTKYCCFLADDDYLIGDEVFRAVKYLEEHPEVVCYYAPCAVYDELAGAPVFHAFYTAMDETISDPVRLWNFVINRHVWPEHAIYRRDGLEEILAPRGPPYWCFTDLANAFAMGPVHFAQLPYYRNLTTHPLGERKKLGDAQALIEFDAYRWGLEILAHDIFADRLTDNEWKEKVHEGIQIFMYTRIKLAHVLMERNGHDYLAQMYQKRLDMFFGIESKLWC